jgi:hypothetical protein
MPERTPEQIRASIEANRAELAVSVTKLRGEVERVRGEIERLTDWRGFLERTRTQLLERNRTQVLVGVAVAGFVLGGGIAAIGGLARRRR